MSDLKTNPDTPSLSIGNSQAVSRSPQDYRLDCLEVWGGTGEIDHKVEVTGLDVWVWSSPADEVAGGDLYFVSMCACAEVSRLFVADVSGHDAEAADLAGRLRKLMRKHINKPDQTRLAQALNRDFDRISDQGKFATAILATFYPPSRQLMVCNAGHPRPLCYSARTQAWVPLDPKAPSTSESVRNLPFGIIEDARFSQFAVKMEPGDLMLIYTDGITESQDQAGKLLREQGLIDLLSPINPERPEDLIPAIQQKMRFASTENLGTDDRTVMLIQANGQQPPQQGMSQRLRVMAKMLGLIDHAH